MVAEPGVSGPLTSTSSSAKIPRPKRNWEALNLKVSERYLEARKAKIAEVAMRMYCEVGRDVSMARICEEAGIAKGTIFRYFPTRDALFDSVFDTCRAHALAMAGEGVEDTGDAPSTLKALIRQSFEWPLRFPMEFRFVVMYTDASDFFAMDEKKPGGVLFDALGSTQFSSLAANRLRGDLPPMLSERLLSAQINTACRYMIAREAEVEGTQLDSIVEAIYQSVFI